MASKIRNQSPPQAPYSDVIRADAIEEYRGVQKAAAGNIRSFVDIDTGTNIRSTFTREHYEYYRPEESVPHKQKAIIAYCADAYRRVGPLYNIINLMADFASQGIKLVHRSPQVQRFYREWFKKVNGKERSERFANLILRMGTVIPLRVTAQLNETQLKTWRRSVAKPDMYLGGEPELDKYEIPVRYIFLNPLSVEVIGEQFAQFTSSPRYALRLSRNLTNRFAYPDNEDTEVLKTVPPKILKAIQDGTSLVPLDPAKTSVYFYKKDDWQLWADPLANVVLDDIILLEKMKLCDLSAVDGSISAIRLWTIGDIKERIFPTKATIARLNQQLTNNVGGGVGEFIWGPELKFQESASNSYRYLGKAKYEAVYEAINQGLGIPSAMSGNAGAGFTNNYIQLKTLVERLQYVRNILTMFWEAEIAIVQKSIGLRHAATVHFDKMILSDEAAEKKLLIDMADRNMISVETVLERCGEMPEIEKLRVKREEKGRTKGRVPSKAGPFHNPHLDHDLRKTFVQLGVVTPSEMGVDLMPNKDGQKTKQEQADEAAKMKGPTGTPPVKGQPGQGRPKNSRDVTTRKQKRVLPKTTGGPLYSWAYDAQGKISKIIEPALLQHFGKANLRQLTKEEFDVYDKFRASIFYELIPFADVDASTVQPIFEQTKGAMDQSAVLEYQNLHVAFVDYLKRQPTLDEVRQLRAMAFLISNVEFVED
jgi:hypothetical protein